jgi:hypothetical protein
MRFSSYNFDSGFCCVHSCSEKKIRAGFDMSDRTIPLSVDIATGYGLDVRGWFPAAARDPSPFHIVQTNSGAHPAPYPTSTGGVSPEGKSAWE